MPPTRGQYSKITMAFQQLVPMESPGRAKAEHLCSGLVVPGGHKLSRSLGPCDRECCG